MAMKKNFYYRLTEKLGERLSNGLSTMEMFYVVAFLVVCPLLVQRPEGLIPWIQYISTAILQAVALPLLGYTTKKSGEAQEKVIRDTHAMLHREIADIKDMHKDLHELLKIEKSETAVKPKAKTATKKKK